MDESCSFDCCSIQHVVGSMGCAVSAGGVSFGRNGSYQLPTDMAVCGNDRGSLWGGVCDCGDQPAKALANRVGRATGEIVGTSGIFHVGDEG